MPPAYETAGRRRSGGRGPWHSGRMEIEIVAFDVFGTLVDWRSSVAAHLARVGERAGLQADWPVVADAWRSRYQPTLNR